MKFKLPLSKIFPCLAIPLVSLGSTCSIAAVEWDNGIDIRIGAMSASNSTAVRLNVLDPGLGIEDKLQLDEDITSGRFAIAWRFKNRHAISIESYQLHRDGRNTAQEDFNFYTSENEYVQVSANAAIDSQLNFDIYDISYSYSFIKNDRHHFSASAGLYWMDIGLGIKASGSGDILIDGVPVSGNATLDESVSIGAPMPLFGIQYDYAISQQWTVNLNARYFDITLDPYAGSIANIDVSTSYYFNKFFIGAGFNWVDLDVNVSDDDWQGGLSWNFKGPHVFIGTHF